MPTVNRVICSCTDSFLAAVLVVSAVPDTCVEIWRANGDSMELVNSQYLPLSHQVSDFDSVHRSCICR